MANDVPPQTQLPQPPQLPQQQQSSSSDLNNNNIDSANYDNENCEIYNFLQYQIPKVELHAHLNGCIPRNVLRRLAKERNVTLSAQHFSVVNNNDNENDDDGIIKNTKYRTMTHYNQNSCHRRTLHDCFTLFDELPLVINDLSALEQITTAALQQFAYHHHTVYLELRTTPKRLLWQYQYPNNDNDSSSTSPRLCTKREYMETILRIVHQFEHTDHERYDRECRESRSGSTIQDIVDENDHVAATIGVRLPITCRILISVDRSLSILEATENIDLAISLFQQPPFDATSTTTRSSTAIATESYIVGVDLGGNPMKQDFSLFEPLFQRARTAGLKITIHCAELSCCSTSSESNGEQQQQKQQQRYHQEIQRIFQFHPDRLGHCVLLPPDLIQQLDRLQIPVETCPTSNAFTAGMLPSSSSSQLDTTTNNVADTANIDADNANHNRPNAELTVSFSSSSLPSDNNTTKKETTDLDQWIQPIVNGLRQHHYMMKHWLTPITTSVAATATAIALTVTVQPPQRNHHDNRYPIIICTDDPGIFDTNLSQELYIVYKAFIASGPSSSSSSSLQQQQQQIPTILSLLLQLLPLVEHAIDYAFCSKTTQHHIKQLLQQRIRTIIRTHSNNNNYIQ